MCLKFTGGGAAGTGGYRPKNFDKNHTNFGRKIKDLPVVEAPWTTHLNYYLAR